MKPIYVVMAILASVTILTIVTISSQQIYAPRTCGSCSEFKKLTHEFEKDVLDAATVDDPNIIPGLLEQYVEDVRALDLASRS